MSKESQTIITVGLILFAILAWLWPFVAAMQMELEARRKRGEPPEYDERQRIARLRAGNHALFALLGFLGVWMAVDQFGWFAWTGSTLDLTLCALLLAWGVWAADCVLHDAFVTWKDKRKDANAAALTFCIPMASFVRSFCVSGACMSWMPFLFACANALILASVIFYKYRKTKKAEIEDTP